MIDNFLSNLFYERFKSTEEEKRYRALHDFMTDNETIRNDQKISETSKKTALVDRLIEEYLKLHGFSSGCR